MQPAYSRLLAVVATLLVIAAPIVLAVATLAPLESAPRGGRAPVLEEAAPVDRASVEDGTPSTDQQNGGRRSRRNRDRDQGENQSAEPELVTPAP
jgi:hypothetical protein